MDEEVMMGDNDGSILINTVIKENDNPNFDCHEETLPMYHVGSEKNETLHSRLIIDQACKDEYEHWLWEQSVESCGKTSLLLEKTREIAGLRRELELITMLLTGHENRDVEALEGKNRSNQLHFKNSGSVVSASTNSKHVGSVTLTPETLEDLRQLSREQLINHFKTEMNQLKREHDYTIQEMTEEYFSIKRRYLKLEECGSFSSLKMDKKFDVLRQKIPDIILKLDKVLLLEGDKSVFEGKIDVNVKSQLDSLLLENCQLKDSLLEAGKKMSQLSQVEENHRNLIRKLEAYVEDSHVEVSIHECCAVIYKEALKEADKKLGELNMNLSEKEQALRTEVLEKERIKEEIHLLECHVKEKENLLQIHDNELATKREKLEIAFQLISSLQYQIEQ